MARTNAASQGGCPVAATWTYAFWGAGRHFTETSFFGRPACLPANVLDPKDGCALKCATWTDDPNPKQHPKAAIRLDQSSFPIRSMHPMVAKKKKLHESFTKAVEDLEAARLLHEPPQLARAGDGVVPARLERALDHLGLPPGHGAGGGGGQEAVQRRHGLGPGVTRTLNSNFIKISALITTRPGTLNVGYTNTLA